MDGKKHLREIFNRIKAVEGLMNDTELCPLLGATKGTLGQWKNRGSISWTNIANYCGEKMVSMDWIILGRGAARPDQLIVQEPGAIYHVATDQDVLYQLAADVHRAIGEARVELSPEKVATVVRLLHRDMLRAGEDSVPYEKVLEFVRLAS